MDDATIALIIEAAHSMPPEEQGQYIARQAIAAARASDAAISDQALEDEFCAWFRVAIHPLNKPAFHAISTHMAWGRHLLNRGRHG